MASTKFLRSNLYFPQKPLSGGIMRKLIQICQKETRLAERNANMRLAQEDYFFNDIPDDLDGAIAILHKRYQSDPYTINEINDAVENILSDESVFKQRAFAAFRALQYVVTDKAYYNVVIEKARDAWYFVGLTIFRMADAIKTGSSNKLDDEERRDVNNFLRKFSFYDNSQLSLFEFINKYFFGSFQTPFFNNLRVKQLGLKKFKLSNGKIVYRLPETTSWTTPDEKYGLEDMVASDIESNQGRPMKPVQWGSHPWRLRDDTTDFDIQGASRFLSYWNTRTKEEKVKLIVQAIKESNSEEFKHVQITEDLIRAAFPRITDNISKAEKILRNINSADGDNKRRLLFNLRNLLESDFIFRELFDISSNVAKEEDTAEYQYENESEKGSQPDTASKSLEDMYSYNRGMLSDIAKNQFPISQSALSSVDPFGFRGIVSSSDLNEALANPSVALNNKRHKNAIMNYIIILAMLHADSRYGYSVGKSGKKAKGETFDDYVAHFIKQEIDIIFGSSLDDKQKSQLFKTIDNIYYDTSEDQIRRYRSFMNIVHRDLAATHAIYSSGYQWGELTPEQIDEISNKIVSNVYPMISDYENSRRQFKALKSPTVTSVVEQLGESDIFNFVKNEIIQKNNALKEELKLHTRGQNAHSVDVNSLVQNFAVKFYDLFTKLDETQKKTASSNSSMKILNFNGMIDNNTINYGKKPNHVDKLFSKWAMKSLLK